MLSRSQQLRIGLIGLFLSLLCGVGVCANPFSTLDSALKVYYRDCRLRINEPEVLPMCDTLYLLAEEKHEPRMQAMALSTQVDHYFRTENLDGIVATVGLLRDFCAEETNPELLRFYYMAWANRLILYYMSHSQANAAVYEACKMLAQAQKDNYPRGIAESYRILGDIYFAQSNFGLAYDNYRMSIRVVENSDIDDIPLTMQYVAQTECAIELNMPDSAAMILKKLDIEKHHSPYPEYTINRVAIQYYIYIGDMASAQQLLDATQTLFDTTKGLAAYRSGFELLKSRYYTAAGKYDDALSAVLRVDRNSRFLPERVLMNINKLMGDIYWQLGRKADAAASYRDYIDSVDSLRKQESRRATTDLSGILEMVHLQNSTRELELGMQQKRLHTTYMAIVLLGALVVLLVAYQVWTMRLNRRLKASEAHVLAKNEELRASGEELRIAKEMAEEASMMKTNFIQNMSHEVRTPLNSIVGFSLVLASQFRNDPSTREYASIIESSSSSLLRMVDDVLEVAYLDQVEVLPAADRCEMNNCCRDCVDKILLQVQPGLAVIFESSKENPVVKTNKKRIMQVLGHLLHNAAKFSGKGQVVLSYTCLMQERLMRFIVTDNGPGIREEEQEAVFDRFVKLDPFAEGTGLGLPVCRLIAQKMGGSLRVDSTYKKGCRMILEVPFELADDSVV